MATRTFQSPDNKPAVIVNDHEHDGISIGMFPDGSLSLAPAGWPHGKMDSMFNTIIMLRPADVVALARFLSGRNVADRLLDVRQRIDTSPETKRLLNDIAKRARRARQKKQRQQEPAT